MPDEQTEDSAPEYRAQEEEKPSPREGLDPDLHQIILGHRAAMSDLSPSNVESDGAAVEDVDVIAKLLDPAEPVPGLHVVKRIGQIVTGAVNANQIEEVRGHSNVFSLKAARRLRPTLETSVKEIQATSSKLQAAFPAVRNLPNGSHVIVGIVDHGCDFAHPNFRKPDGTTRVLYLWDQRDAANKPPPGAGGKPPKPYRYGREFNWADIDVALQTHPPDKHHPTNPHKFLEYDILPASHGTAVMDVAAGNGSGGLHPPGIAPVADIIFVDTSSRGVFPSDTPLGDSRRILDAVAYVFDKADKLGRPAVVNISLNYEAGPHDGTTLIEQGFDHLLESPGRAIVIAAGNSGVRRIHVRRTLHPGRTHTLRWLVGQDERSNNKLEMWYDGRRAITLTLRSPRQGVVGAFPLDSTYTIYRKDMAADKEVQAGFVFHRAKDPNNGDNNLVLAFTPLMEAGIWELDLELLDDGSQRPLEVNAWTETDKQPSFFPDATANDSACTLGTLGCGNSTIVVGAYSDSNPDTTFTGTGEGPTRDGKLKPEVSAPGVGINAANSVSPWAPTRAFSGTSAAAPHVTGLVALLMQTAGTLLPVEEIRKFVIDTVRPTPFLEEPKWDTRYGAGRVSGQQAIGALMGIEPAPVDEAVTRPSAPAVPIPPIGFGGDAPEHWTEGLSLPPPAAPSTVNVPALTTLGADVGVAGGDNVQAAAPPDTKDH